MQEQGEQMILKDITEQKLCKWCNMPLPSGSHRNRDYHIGECEQKADKARRDNKKLDGYKRREKAFLNFNSEHPEVRRHLIKKAREKVRAGANRLSIRHLFYEVREEYKIRIANNHSRFYADDFNKMPEFVNMFKQAGKGNQ